MMVLMKIDHSLNTQSNILTIKNAIEKPQFFLVDKTHTNRLDYFAMVELEYRETRKLNGLHIVTEKSELNDSQSEVVTIRPQTRVSIQTNGRVILYDVYEV